jgi:hypothetical protein
MADDEAENEGHKAEHGNRQRRDAFLLCSALLCFSVSQYAMANIDYSLRFSEPKLNFRLTSDWHPVVSAPN